MAKLFETLDESELTEDGRRYKREIETEFGTIEEFFARLESSPKRLKLAKEFPMPALAAPIELAVVYSLRALELAEGAAALIERGYGAAVFPVVRSLYELWMALVFAVKNFEKLVVRGDRWQEFDNLSYRLILGANARPEGPNAISIGRMLSAAGAEMKSFGNTDPDVGDSLVKHHKQTYAELCDGSHPTQWGVIGHAEVRDDGLGIRWHRKPRDTESTRFLVDLSICLRLFREWVARLELTGDEIEAAARRAEAQDPSIRASTVGFLERLLEDDTGAISEDTVERVRVVLTQMKAGEGSGQRSDQ